VVTVRRKEGGDTTTSVHKIDEKKEGGKRRTDENIWTETMGLFGAIRKNSNEKGVKPKKARSGFLKLEKSGGERRNYKKRLAPRRTGGPE